MSDEPVMSDHPDADHPPPETTEDDAPQEEDTVGEPMDPVDPQKREEHLPGADPVMEPFSPD